MKNTTKFPFEIYCTYSSTTFCFNIVILSYNIFKTELFFKFLI